ncbi:MAG: transcriptional repressor LexA [Firmicutes bacterium]|nr:transcriptional repressor LexA [Bacillota bacterium]
MEENLTDKQKEILAFLNNEVKEKGYPPSVREICHAVGFKSTSTVHTYLEKLKKRGLIQKDPSKPRAIRIIDNADNKPFTTNEIYLCGKKIVNVPIVGRVTAGQPILAVENIEDSFPLPAEIAQSGEVFMLKVQGESMINAGILDGDFVVVRQQNSAENGDIVVALIEDEATIKTFYREKDFIRLQPENPYMDPIIVKDNIPILGKVIGVFRKL